MSGRTGRTTLHGVSAARILWNPVQPNSLNIPIIQAKSVSSYLQCLHRICTPLIVQLKRILRWNQFSLQSGPD